MWWDTYEIAFFVHVIWHQHIGVRGDALTVGMRSLRNIEDLHSSSCFCTGKLYLLKYFFFVFGMGGDTTRHRLWDAT